MRRVSGLARVIPALQHRRGAAVVHIGRRQIPQAAVMMRVVVPRDQVVADRARILEGAEAARKLRSVFDRPELGFGKRIVVAHARPRVAGGDPEVGEQFGDELAPHRRATISMDGELVRRDPLLVTRRLDQALGELRALVGRDHPADDVPAEEVEDHVER